MDLKDMILVMENYKGTERNMLMTLEDYKKFVAIDDMSELADQMLLLGRTLAEGFTEYYRKYYRQRKVCVEKKKHKTRQNSISIITCGKQKRAV